MAMGRPSRGGRRALIGQSHGGGGGVFSRWIRVSSSQSQKRRVVRTIIISLVFVALFPPIFLHFRLRRLHQIQVKKCGWVKNPPLVCAHGGDSSNAFPNTMAAYESAIRSRVDCIEIDVSRSSDGVLLALHDRDLQRISGNTSSKVGHLSMKQIKELGTAHQHVQKLDGGKIPTIEAALKFVSGSVRQVILDAKVGPPSYERGLAKDILSVLMVVWKHLPPVSISWSIHDVLRIKRTQCKNCLVWAKSDNLARDVIKQSSDTMVGYIVMIDPTTGLRTNLLRMKGAAVVGVYHPLIDEKLVRILHRRSKKVYAWTVDDMNSMRKVLFEGVDAVVTSDPTLLQQLMQDTRTQCLEEGFPFSQ